MKTFRTRRMVPFSPRQMFDLVADVDTYPQFLPLCEAMKVRSRRSAGNDIPDGEILIADMTMGYKSIRETISSRVILDPGQPRVGVHYLGGPFSRMENEWLFVPVQGGCEVQFYIGYEVKNPLLGFLVSQLFDKAFKKFASAFEARAHQVYGRRAPISIGAPLTSER